MPRSNSVLEHSGHKTTSTTYCTAAITPPRSKDLETKLFDLPRGPWTPAELVSTRGWGEDVLDTRPNVGLKFSVDVTTVEEEEDSCVQETPTYHFKLTAAPVLFIRPVTVELDSWTSSNIEAPGAPLWLCSMVQENRVVREQRPDLVIPHYGSWIKVLNTVDCIKGLYDAAARPRPKCSILLCPVQRIKDLPDALAILNISDAGYLSTHGSSDRVAMDMD